MSVFTSTIFDHPQAANNTSAYGINDAGQIVGYYQDSRGEAHGFLLSGGTYTNLDVPSAKPGFGTLEQGINDGGQIVGYYEDDTAGFHGFLYSGGTYTTLDDPSFPTGPGFPAVAASSLSPTAKAVIPTLPSTIP